jgi:hypothetical protein
MTVEGAGDEQMKFSELFFVSADGQLEIGRRDGESGDRANIF